MLAVDATRSFVVGAMKCSIERLSEARAMWCGSRFVVAGVGFENEKQILKRSKRGTLILIHLISSNFDFYLQRINDTLEIPSGAIWACEEARGASLLQRHSRRYRTECFRYLCELVRSRRIDLRGIGKGICCRRGKRAIQSL